MHACSWTDSGIPNRLRMTEFTVQSSFKLTLPPHLIITASSVKLNEIIGQGNIRDTCMTNACTFFLLNLAVTSYHIMSMVSIQASLVLSTRLTLLRCMTNACMSFMFNLDVTSYHVMSIVSIQASLALSTRLTLLSIRMVKL